MEPPSEIKSCDAGLGLIVSIKNLPSSFSSAQSRRKKHFKCPYSPSVFCRAFVEFMHLECEAFACTQHIGPGGGFWLGLFPITIGPLLAFDQSLGSPRERGPCPDRADTLESRGDSKVCGLRVNRSSFSGEKTQNHSLQRWLHITVRKA